MDSTNEPTAAPPALRCSVALSAPVIPNEAYEFASAVGDLCDKYGIRNLTMEVRLDKFTSDHKYRPNIASDVKVFVSTKDERGRPVKNVSVQANVCVTAHIVSNPSTTD